MKPLYWQRKYLYVRMYCAILDECWSVITNGCKIYKKQYWSEEEVEMKMSQHMIQMFHKVYMCSEQGACMRKASFKLAVDRIEHFAQKRLSPDTVSRAVHVRHFSSRDRPVHRPRPRGGL